MFDWNAELELAKRQIAELEEKVSSAREALATSGDGPVAATPIERILAERGQRTLSVMTAR